MDTRVRMGSQGRIVLPAQVRRAMGVQPGDELTLVVEEGELRLRTPRAARAEAQRLVQMIVAGDRSLARELIEERHAEAARE